VRQREIIAKNHPTPPAGKDQKGIQIFSKFFLNVHQ
jgi:hypothetical protein